MNYVSSASNIITLADTTSLHSFIVNGIPSNHNCINVINSNCIAEDLELINQDNIETNDKPSFVSTFLLLVIVALVITTFADNASHRFIIDLTIALSLAANIIADATFYLLHFFHPGLLKRGSVGIPGFIALGTDPTNGYLSQYSRWYSG